MYILAYHTDLLSTQIDDSLLLPNQFPEQIDTSAIKCLFLLEVPAFIVDVFSFFLAATFSTKVSFKHFDGEDFVGFINALAAQEENVSQPIILTDADFDQKISSGSWVVSFLDHDIRQDVALASEYSSVISEWNGLAAPLKNSIHALKFGSINCKENSNSCSKN
ncbi:hypothetical protein BB560_004194, partial [Smittium megazygosporum]